MEFVLRRHKDDDEMLEIIKDDPGGFLLYGVIHHDFISDDFYIRKMLESKDTAKVTIELKSRENPWCAECLEKDCIVEEGSCAVIQVYHRFKKYGAPLAEEAKAIRGITGSKDVRAFATSVLFVLGKSNGDG